jgi:ABC-type nitrate/sulfonate/bicarbonate transport system substrate-binding protein
MDFHPEMRIKEMGSQPRLIFTTGIILLGLLLLAHTGCRQQSQEASRSVEKITFAYQTSTSAVLAHIALQKKYFAAEGLNVTPRCESSGKAALDAVLEGEADFATVADTPIVFAITKGNKIYIIAEIQNSAKNEAIVAKQDRGITKPSDLRGKTIGVTEGTTGDFFLDSFFLVHGIDRQAVKIIDLKPEEMSNAFIQGRVDAVSTWNPLLKHLQKVLGDKGIVFFDENIYTELFCVVAKQEFAKKNPGVIKKVLKALIKAEAFVQQHPEEARKLIAQSTQTDESIVAEIWNSLDSRVSLDQSLLVSLDDQTRWAKKFRLTACTETPNYLDFIYFDGLQSVRPDSVRIIR